MEAGKRDKFSGNLKNADVFYQFERPTQLKVKTTAIAWLVISEIGEQPKDFDLSHSINNGVNKGNFPTSTACVLYNRLHRGLRQ